MCIDRAELRALTGSQAAILLIPEPFVRRIELVPTFPFGRTEGSTRAADTNVLASSNRSPQVCVQVRALT